MTNYDIINLKSAINDFVVKLDVDLVLSSEDKKLIIESHYSFIIDSIVKYIKGQKAHGGKITDRDLDEEIRQELIDLFWYHAAKDSLIPKQ